MKYSISFLFQTQPQVRHTFDRVYCSKRSILSNRLGFYWISPHDIRKLYAGIKRSDIFVSSFIWNPYTIVGLTLCKLFDKKLIVWEEVNIPRPGLRSAIKNTIRKMICGHVDAFFVLGDVQNNTLRKLGVIPEKIFMANEYPAQVYSRVKSSKAPSRIDKDVKVILFIGRLVEFKGVEYLIRAFKQVESVHGRVKLLIVGDGPLRAWLETLSRTLGVKNAFFLGQVTNLQKAYLLNRSSMVVVPSIVTKKRGEGGPIVVLEALSAGKPVVGSTALGSSAAFIQNGINGFIVPEKDANALAEKIEWLLANPIPASRVLSNFNKIKGVEHQVEQFENSVNYVLSGKQQR
ncbi:MAG: glycosyltransferase family 4 protein [Candidatus Bathyarchaeia archaeon]